MRCCDLGDSTTYPHTLLTKPIFPSHNDAIRASLPRLNPCRVDRIPRGRGAFVLFRPPRPAPGTLMAAAATRMDTPATPAGARCCRIRQSDMPNAVKLGLGRRLNRGDRRWDRACWGEWAGSVTTWLLGRGLAMQDFSPRDGRDIHCRGI